MKPVTAYKGLNGQIFNSEKEARDSDEQFIDQKVVDDLAKMFSDVGARDIWTLVMRRRKELFTLFEKYDEMRRDALDS